VQKNPKPTSLDYLYQVITLFYVSILLHVYIADNI